MNNNDIQYLNEISYSYWKAQVLFVAVELDLFTLIEGKGKSCKTVTKTLRTNLRATEMFLNALVSLGLLSKVNGIYKNTAISNSYLVRNRSLYQGDRIHHFHNLWDYWSRLGVAVKTGKPTAYDDAEEEVDEHSLREFIKAMHNIGIVQAGEVCRKLHLRKYHRLLDLGGGQGTYAIKFVEKNPKMRAVVFDLPDVIKITKEHIKKSGMKGQVVTKSGDCLKDDFGKELYDIVFISNLLHIYKPNENQKILKKCWDSLSEKGIVVIQEFILNSAKTKPVFGTLFSLNMLIGTSGGSSYTGVEMRNWLKKTGFKKIKKINLNLDSGLIIGHKV
ncbi:MAG: methyltransferase [Candidatus Scalindua rubra]|uniref:Methyltransferase n=1 Tax=Candidatus Scalindua rubra TaxID=1872076 RepID=A0A1E3X5Y7_9BACT|nr:MAG: methyltransferase [Candidatus Scalindua rubra]